jgi:phage regulator Rha-like protein
MKKERELVILKNMTALTTTLIVAEELERGHEGIYKVVNTYKKQFETFGTLLISNRKSIGGRPGKFYYLNEQQFVFLIMNLRSKKSEHDKVMDLKIKIAKQFFSMKNIIEKMKFNVNDKEWIDTRKDEKIERMKLTDVIKDYINYAVNNGSKTYKNNPQLAYSKFSELQIKALFDYNCKLKNVKDVLSTQQLKVLYIADQILQKTIFEGICNKIEYHEIYYLAKENLNKYAEMLGKTKVLEMANQISMI